MLAVAVPVYSFFEYELGHTEAWRVPGYHKEVVEFLRWALDEPQRFADMAEGEMEIAEGISVIAEAAAHDRGSSEGLGSAEMDAAHCRQVSC